MPGDRRNGNREQRERATEEMKMELLRTMLELHRVDRITGDAAIVDERAYIEKVKELEELASTRIREGGGDGERRKSMQQLRTEAHARNTLQSFAAIMRDGAPTPNTGAEAKRDIMRQLSQLVDQRTYDEAMLAVDQIVRRANMSPTAGAMFHQMDTSKLSDNYPGNGARNFKMSDAQIDGFLQLAGDRLEDGEQLIAPVLEKLLRVPVSAYSPIRRTLQEMIGEADGAHAEQEVHQRVAQILLKRNRQHNHEHTFDELPRLTPHMAQDFLREADVNNGEQPCAAGDKCVARSMHLYAPLHSHAQSEQQQAQPHAALAATGFIMRAFTLPRERRGGAARDTPAVCLLCNRLMTQINAFALMRAHLNTVASGSRTQLRIQDHTYLVGPDGYSADVMLPITGGEDGSQWNGLIEPFIESNKMTYGSTTVPAPSDPRVRLRALYEQPSNFFGPAPADPGC